MSDAGCLQSAGKTRHFESRSGEVKGEQLDGVLLFRHLLPESERSQPCTSQVLTEQGLRRPLW